MKILLVTAPYDSGHYKQRLGLGPVSLAGGMEEHLQHSGHAVRRAEIHINTTFPTEVTTSFEVSRSIADVVCDAKVRNEFPIVVTGNCNTAAIGTLSGLRDGSGVVWFDCHGDYNTPETTIGGFLDGMALSIVAGHCWKQLAEAVPGFKPVPETKIILAGARDFDPLESQRLSGSQVTLITPEMIKQLGPALYAKLIPMESVYLHIDLDVLDPGAVKVNTYSTGGGLSPDELCRMIEVIKHRYRLSALAFTAYDPSLDRQKKVPEIVNRLLSVIL